MVSHMIIDDHPRIWERMVYTLSLRDASYVTLVSIASPSASTVDWGHVCPEIDILISSASDPFRSQGVEMIRVPIGW